MIRQRAAVELAREKLAQSSLVRLRVSSDSMAPLIEQGDTVLVRSVHPRDLRRGDLLLVERDGSFLVHRLVAAGAHDVQTKGDNVSHADPAVALQEVLGRVVAVERGGRRIELEEGRWPLVNRSLGLLGWYEVRLFAAGRKIKRRLVGARSGRLTRGLASLAAVPFRWMTRLLLMRIRP